MIYAVASEVPAGCDYITAGKRYEVITSDAYGFASLDDERVELYGKWECSSHLDFENWHRIETDENGWAYWEPKHYGDAPPDWQDGWEWNMPPYDDEPEVSIFPSWDAAGNKYRYRPAQQATEQTETERELADVHAEMMDLRRQVEVLQRRLQDECAEYDWATERVCRLEALICDTLLDHAD